MGGEMNHSFEMWLRNEGKTDGTIKEYLTALNKLTGWYEKVEKESFDPIRVTTLHLHDFKKYLDEELRLSPSTVNKTINGLRSFFSFSVEAGNLQYDPSRKLKLKRSQTNQLKPKWLTKQETAKYYHEIYKANNEWFRARDLALSRLMSSAGLRIQEVADLQMSDIVLEKRREIVNVRGGKGGKARILPCNGDLVGDLKEWLRLRETRLIKPSAEKCLFISERGTKLAVRSIFHVVQSYGEAARIHGMHPHRLRHSYGRRLIESGNDLIQVAYLMGHESIETTKIYILPGEREHRMAVNSISEIRME